MIGLLKKKQGISAAQVMVRHNPINVGVLPSSVIKYKHFVDDTCTIHLLNTQTGN
jgi:hypothetical protein